MTRRLLKGNEALVYGALLGGSTHYFGYPITPASEIAHAAAALYPKCGRHFLQTECEVASISMLYGAAGAGARVMTGTSGLGLSLMAEQLSYMAGAELPCVICDVQRVGPGLGNIWPEQSDYNCTVHGGGHGHYHTLVLAPDSAQEMCDMAYHAFEQAETYRMPVIILSDAYIGQMMEPVNLPQHPRSAPRHDWALYADAASRKNVVTSIFMNPQEMADLNARLVAKYDRLQQEAVQVETYLCEDAQWCIVAFGISARIARTAVRLLRDAGLKVGLIRPVTLFPFPEKVLREYASRGLNFAVFELNGGQMIGDVQRIVRGNVRVEGLNWFGGIVPSPNDVVSRFKAVCV